MYNASFGAVFDVRVLLRRPHRLAGGTPGGNTRWSAAGEEQAQESMGLVVAATRRWDTASNVEQGLEVELVGVVVLGNEQCRQTRVTARGQGKPVNGRQRGNTRPNSDGPHGGKMGNQLRIVAAGEEEGSGGRERIAGKLVRSKRKRGEPHGREQGATNLHGRGGASRRGGEKPRGRNEVGAWQRRPEGEPVATPTSWELTPRSSATEGRSLENPKRGIPVSLTSERQDRNVSGKRRGRSRGWIRSDTISFRSSLGGGRRRSPWCRESGVPRQGHGRQRQADKP